MPAADAARFAECGRAPVLGGTSPAGRDPSASPEYAFLIEQMRDREKGLSPDWERVAATAKTLLLKHGKSLNVAAHLQFSLSRLYGFEGFCRGIAIMRDMVSLYWESMYPDVARTKARSNALSLWEADLRLFIRYFTSDAPVKEELADQLESDARELDAVLNAHMETPPFMGEVIRFAQTVTLAATPLEPALLPSHNSSLITPEFVEKTVPLPKRPAGAMGRVLGTAGSFLGFGTGSGR